MIATPKTSHLALTLAAIVGLASFLASAQQNQTKPPPAAPGKAGTDRATEQDPNFATERLGLIQKTSWLIGKEVENNKQKSLGKIADLALDFSNGSVPFVLVSSGSDYVPVPARSFFGLQREKLILNVDEKAFADAPRVPKANWLTALNASTLEQAYRHFGRAASEATSQPNEWLAASAISSTRLLSQANGPLGQVEDAMVDIPLARLAYVLVRPTVGSNPANTRYAIPPQAARVDAANRALVLQADQNKFLAGPHFEKDFFSSLSDKNMAAKIYSHYGVSEHFSATSARPDQRVYGQNADRPAASAPSATTTGGSDQTITQNILREIVQSSLANAHAANGISVNTASGRVTLRGTVDNEKRKAELGQIAERVAGAGNVDNQLVVGSKK
jgi:sporulation protein YlmC with PRC-barrel domain